MRRWAADGHLKPRMVGLSGGARLMTELEEAAKAGDPNPGRIAVQSGTGGLSSRGAPSFASRMLSGAYRHQEPAVPSQTRLTVASELCLNLWSRWRGSRMEDVVATPVRDVVLH